MQSSAKKAIQNSAKYAIVRGGNRRVDEVAADSQRVHEPRHVGTLPSKDQLDCRIAQLANGFVQNLETGQLAREVVADCCV